MTSQIPPSDKQLDIVALARANEDFRRVVTTGPKMQVVVMTVPPDGEIGEETHPDTDQVLFVVEGRGESVLEGERRDITTGDLIFVPAGMLHNFVTRGDEPLRIITAYAPPEHEPGTVHATKAEADADEHEH